ncbi:hypothetical protein [Nonomuraea indica]|uniref:Uncharacterized protein n=1 Tax=Nonomuraea indica TaxID=1581193 RepID=A0ABW8A4D9_9ACTN|nr:hypothetical protein [Nonomuraea indica]
MLRRGSGRRRQVWVRRLILALTGLLVVSLLALVGMMILLNVGGPR